MKGKIGHGSGVRIACVNQLRAQLDGHGAPELDGAYGRWGELESLAAKLKFLAPRCQEMRNLKNGFICYHARSHRSKLRGPGAHPARVRNHERFFPCREAP